MSATPANQQNPEDRDRLSAYVQAQMERGFSGYEVQQQLVSQGLDLQSAKSIVRAVARARRQLVRKAGFYNMIIGGSACVFGLAITAISFWIASEYSGGTFIVAAGAIGFGLLRFLYGLVQTLFGST